MRRTGTIILGGLLLAMLCGAAALAQTGNGTVEPPNTGGLFTDVPRDHWAYEDLEYLAARGIITGLPGGRYEGDQPLDRYSAAALFARAIQYMQNNPASVTPEDLDVLKDLIFGLTDDLDTLRAEVGALQRGGDTELANRVALNEQQISQINVELQDISSSSGSTLAKRVQANFIISLTALLVGIIGVALATLGL
ncbi:S-layer homology domain-containing protein, partial [Candidatus Bipolaricaulota bacterium]